MRHPVLTLSLCGVVLAACVGGAGLGGSSAKPVLQGALNIATPMGYCVDQAASREGQDSAIVLMGRCTDRAAVKPALVTLSVGQAGSAGVLAAGGAELATFFTSPEGRATLSPTGRAAEVRVVEALSSGDAFLMRLQEAGDPGYWRAILGLRGRLITVSVKGTAEAALPVTEGREILDRTVAGLRRANPNP
jgi:hypothetical protein